jgi:hypothetical protein
MTDTLETDNVFTFQPTDADGNPIGIPVEISYTDQKDLQAKLVAGTQKMKFFVSSRDKIKDVKAPENAERFSSADDDQVRSEAVAFIKDTPGYYVCESNLQAIVDFINENNLQPNKANFSIAYSALAKAGLLLGADGQPTTSDDRTGVSFTDRTGKTWFGMQAIDRMPAEVYGKRLRSEFGFKEKVERVLNGK